MKKVVIIMFILSAASCKCKKDTTTWVPQAVIMSEFPKDGICTTQVLSGKSMVIKNDDFGRPYYETIDNTSKSVIIFDYNRTVKGDIQDASYNEKVIFEIDNSTDNLNLSDTSLQDSQLLFARFCFCKGQTGYYKITQGKLSMSKKANEKTIDLNFKTDEVPQIIKHISISLK